MVAKWLFLPSIQASVDHILTNSTELSTDWTVNRLCTQFNVQCNNPDLAKDVPLGRLSSSSLEEVCFWARTTLPGPLLTYYETIHNYDAFTRTKIELFVNHHITTGYSNPLGLSPYPDDLSFATRTTERAIIKPRPLEVLSSLFPLDEIHPTLLARHIRLEASDEWLEDVFGELFSPLVYHPLRTSMVSADVIRAHSTYCACVYICQLMTEYADVSEACHAYQLAFVDFFYNHCCSSMTDAALWAATKHSDQSTWFRWFPWDTRGFTGDDMPNYMHLLWQIPMRGEVDIEQFPLMKFMIKCMPFACQRRSMMDLGEETVFFFIYTGPLSWPGGVSQCVTYFFFSSQWSVFVSQTNPFGGSLASAFGVCWQPRTLVMIQSTCFSYCAPNNCVIIELYSSRRCPVQTQLKLFKRMTR